MHGCLASQAGRGWACTELTWLLQAVSLVSVGSLFEHFLWFVLTS